MTTHKVENKSGDKSGKWESFLQPVCSCGWKGKQVSCYNNWQMHDLAEQARKHIQATIGLTAVNGSNK